MLDVEGTTKWMVGRQKGPFRWVAATSIFFRIHLIRNSHCCISNRCVSSRLYSNVNPYSVTNTNQKGKKSSVVGNKTFAFHFSNNWTASMLCHSNRFARSILIAERTKHDEWIESQPMIEPMNRRCHHRRSPHRNPFQVFSLGIWDKCCNQFCISNVIPFWMTVYQEKRWKKTPNQLIVGIRETCFSFDRLHLACWRCSSSSSFGHCCHCCVSPGFVRFVVRLVVLCRL